MATQNLPPTLPLTFPQPLSLCSHESLESTWGACDGGMQCSNPATIYDFQTEREFCFAHYREVSRG